MRDNGRKEMKSSVGRGQQIKKFIVDVLNGTSLGIVITLIPSALVSQLLLLFPNSVIAANINFMTTLIKVRYRLLLVLRWDIY